MNMNVANYTSKAKDNRVEKPQNLEELREKCREAVEQAYHEQIA